MTGTPLLQPRTLRQSLRSSGAGSWSPFQNIQLATICQSYCPHSNTCIPPGDAPVRLFRLTVALKAAPGLSVPEPPPGLGDGGRLGVGLIAEGGGDVPKSELRSVEPPAGLERMVVVVGMAEEVGTDRVLADGVRAPVPDDPDPAAADAGGGDLAVPPIPPLPSIEGLRTPPVVEPRDDIEPFLSAALVPTLLGPAPLTLGVPGFPLAILLTVPLLTSMGEEEDEPVAAPEVDGPPSERVERDVVFDSFCRC